MLILYLNSYSHDLHISVTNIQIINDSTIAKICIKAELDDFIKVCKDKNDSCRTNYINMTIIFYFNGENVNSKMNLIRTELDNNSVWYYYEIKYDKIITQIKSDNYFLLESFDNQKNLLIINDGVKDYGFELNSVKRSLEIQINQK